MNTPRMSRGAAVLLVATAACADIVPTTSVEIPPEPGELQEVPPPPGFEGPVPNAIRIGLSGTLDNTGFALGHLPPEAGEADRIPLLWMACHARENSDTEYVKIDPVEESVLPCGLQPHDDHLDAVIFATPWWEGLIVVNVP